MDRITHTQKVGHSLVNLDVDKRADLRTEMMREFFEEKPETDKSGTALIGFGGKQLDSVIAVLEKAVDKIGGGKA